jgi:cytochrome c biogenesis protein CcmG/thiol:disulfide interchange protein DsbE
MATNNPPKRYPVLPVLIGGAVVIGVAAVIAVAVSGGGKTGNDNGVAQTRPVTVTGPTLATFDDSGTDAAVGNRAPTLVGQNFNATRVTVGDDGHPKMVVFVAHWCPHCRAEVPRLASYLQKTGLPTGVELFIVPTGTNSSYPNYPPSKWLLREGLGKVPTLVDDKNGTAFGAFGGSSYPYMVLLDKNNKVVVRHAGELPDGTYPSLLDALAAGKSITFSSEGGGSTTVTT